MRHTKEDPGASTDVLTRKPIAAAGPSDNGAHKGLKGHVKSLQSRITEKINRSRQGGQAYRTKEVMSYEVDGTMVVRARKG
jgi:hypothetical protein